MAGHVLLTGASSFTGLWIAEALARAGFQVTAPLRRARADYDDLRLERVERLTQSADVVFETPFGSSAMLDLIRAGGRWDLLAHHAADVTNYRDSAYDAAAAFGRNLEGAPAVFRLMAEQGAQAVVATGTVFEAGEGGAPGEDLAVTPYGLAKTLTNEAFRHYARWSGLRFARFVIPSPYGVLEEKRFGWRVFSAWLNGDAFRVLTPRYIRDHTPAPLLAQDYAAYSATVLATPSAKAVLRPSAWIASQGDFARRMATEVSARLPDLACALEFADQAELEEPYVRVNADPIDRRGWDEPAFWDEYVAYYQRLKAAGRLA